MADDYTCAKCGGTFTTGRSDDEARAEAKDQWGGTPDTIPMDVICDDCYQQFMAWYATTADVNRSA